MTEKIPFSGFPRKRRRGVRRVLIHIALFALMGALILSLGLNGRARLAALTEARRDDGRVSALHAGAMDAVQKALVDAGVEQKAVNQGVSSKKSGLKKTITAQVAEGMPDTEIALQAIDALTEGVIGKLGDHEDAITAAREAVSAIREETAESLAAAAEQAAQTLTPGDVRMDLEVSADGYASMYFHVALIVIGAACLLIALALTALWFANNLEGRTRIADFLEPMDYLLPFFLGVGVFTLYPMVRVVIMSFQERYKLSGAFAGWGLDNYDYVINGVKGTSNVFMQGLRNTFIYVLCTIPLSTVLSIVIAWLLNQKLKATALFQTAYFLPMVTSVTAVGLVWRWMFNQNFGLINAVLSIFGVEKINWLLQASNSMPVLVIFGVWSSLPFTIILLLSGLQNIDEHLYTVARVDGSKTFRIFRRITIPLLSPTIGLVLIINSISAFKVFTDVKVLFNGNPGPANNMYTVVYYIYDQMYLNRELGRAAAAAIILFLFIFAFTMAQRVIQRKWNYQ